ncbi:MAG: hypothetical protein ACXAC5_02220 [Promethearchaeota archaeon]|jgi:hypothetical protein
MDKMPGGMLAKQPHEVVVNRDDLVPLLLEDGTFRDEHVQHLLAQLKAQRVEVTTLREPYYRCSDGYQALKSALSNSSSPHCVRNDAQLKDLVNAVSDALDAVHAHLEACYLWD